MRGYAPTSAYKAEYEALVAGDTTLDANVYYSNTKVPTWGVKLPVAHVMLMNVYHLEKHILILLNGR